MLLTKEAKIPDDMGVIWCLTKHLRGQRILRMGNACTRFWNRRIYCVTKLIALNIIHRHFSYLK